MLSAHPYAINDAGQIVLSGYVAGAYVTYIWQEGALTPILGPPGTEGWHVEATSINNVGVAIGSASDGGRWINFLWQNGSAAALPEADGYDAWPWRISDNGVIIGEMYPHDGSFSSAVAAWYPTRMHYAFGGFLRPVDNPPMVNRVRAGAAVPMKFSLGGDQGMEILAGAPQSVPIVCDNTAPIDSVEETASAGSSGLSYDPDLDVYTYVWQTEKVVGRHLPVVQLVARRRLRTPRNIQSIALARCRVPCRRRSLRRRQQRLDAGNSCTRSCEPCGALGLGTQDSPHRRGCADRWRAGRIHAGEGAAHHGRHALRRGAGAKQDPPADRTRLRSPLGLHQFAERGVIEEDDEVHVAVERAVRYAAGDGASQVVHGGGAVAADGGHAGEPGVVGPARVRLVPRFQQRGDAVGLGGVAAPHGDAARPADAGEGGGLLGDEAVVDVVRFVVVAACVECECEVGVRRGAGTGLLHGGARVLEGDAEHVVGDPGLVVPAQLERERVEGGRNPVAGRDQCIDGGAGLVDPAECRQRPRLVAHDDDGNAYQTAPNGVYCMHTVAWRGPMRTTINLDDTLLAEAQRLTGLRERTALVHEGLRALIERESARRLARLGGSEPGLKPVARRRPDAA
jgi:Arc/MetJ family transcription regulator